MTGAKVRLALAALLFFGWLGLLGYTAYTKSRAPIVSRAQAAGTVVAVRAKLTDGGDGRPARQAEALDNVTATGPKPGPILVPNLPNASGFTGTGEYLLLLVPEVSLDGTDTYRVTGQQRSPGADLDGVGPPKIYAWSADVEAQARRLFAGK
jgi:hypothetical protein